MENKEKKYIEKVLLKYQEPTISELDELRLLVSKSRKPALVFSIIFGIFSSLVLGFGMSVAMQVILPQYLWMGIAVGVLGLLLVIINWPIYKRMLQNGKSKYAEQINALSNKLLNE